MRHSQRQTGISDKRAAGRNTTRTIKTAESMAIFDQLKKDHRELQRLAKQILKEEDGASGEARILFLQFKDLLTSHSKVEEAVFYDLLKMRTAEDNNDSGHEAVLEGFEEHHVADMLLKEISELDGREEQWKAKMSVLSEALNHHIEEEESEIFKVGRKELERDEYEVLGKRFVEGRNSFVLVN